MSVVPHVLLRLPSPSITGPGRQDSDIDGHAKFKRGPLSESDFDLNDLHIAVFYWIVRGDSSEPRIISDLRDCSCKYLSWVGI